MFKKVLSKKTEINPRLAIVNIILLTSAFVWYFLAFNVLRDLMAPLNLTDFATMEILGVNFAGIAISAVFGSFVVDKFQKRVPFLYLWMIIGVFFSLIPLFSSPSSIIELIVLSAAFGSYFGLGMPSAMGYFAASTSFENRSKLGGITFLIIGLAFFVLGTVGFGNIVLASVILAAVRLAGLLLFYLLKAKEKPAQEPGKITYARVVSNRSFILYLIPWIMFNLVNYMTVPVTSNLFSQGENFVFVSTVFENILTAVFAIVTGFFADAVGRKRLAIMGFAMLGIGYAALGFFQNTYSWYFYTVVDGIAWGAFYVIFLFTLWGDIAQGHNSEKFYVIGTLPYLFSNFMRLLLGPIMSGIAPTEIFTFASFFLFLAVLPLVYAPETLPETSMKERELKSYYEKAKKVKEKYS